MVGWMVDHIILTLIPFSSFFFSSTLSEAFYITSRCEKIWIFLLAWNRGWHVPDVEKEEKGVLGGGSKERVSLSDEVMRETVGEKGTRAIMIRDGFKSTELRGVRCKRDESRKNYMNT